MKESKNIEKENAMEAAKKKYLDVFLCEWGLYRQKGEAPRGTTVPKPGEGEFDGDVKVGEIRIFADTELPVVGLVLADWKSSGWLIVPVSPFSVPATEQEILIGERVYQLWNVFSAPADFVSKSWVVGTIAAVDMKHVAEAAQSVLSGKQMPEGLSAFAGLPITTADDPRLEYEVRFDAYADWQKVCAGGKASDPEGTAVDKATHASSGHRGKRALELLEAAASIPMAIGKSIGRIAARSRMHHKAMRLPNFRSGHVNAIMCCRLMESPEQFASEHRLDGYDDDLYSSVANMAAGGGSGFADLSAAGVPDAYGRERYAEYAENEFVETRTTPLSTFGLDVDTASYSTMRRYLTEMRRLPPKDSVRLEEYVNYFRFEYPKPEGDVPIAVDCELGDCPWNASHRLLRVGVKAKEIAKENLPPSNLVFLIDVSGSMGGWGNEGGLDMAKAALKLLVSQLRAEDSVSIVTYADGTKVRLESTRADEAGKRRIRRVVDSLTAGGCTYGAGGLELAYEQARKNFDAKSNNRVVLITDGDFNVGISSTAELVRYIEGKRSSGVFLSAIGVGMGNYRDEMMKKLSNAGNGNYAFLDSVMEAKKVFMNEFAGSIYTVAKDVKLQLEFNPSKTAAYRLLGYECRRLAAKDFNDDKKSAGDIGVGHCMTAFYELVPPGAADDVAKVDALKYQKSETVESDELLTVKLRWKAPDGDVSRLEEMPVRAEAITREGGSSEDFRFASAVAEYALLLEDSKFKGEASFRSVIERAKAAKGADASGDRAEFIRLAERAEAYSIVK